MYFTDQGFSTTSLQEAIDSLPSNGGVIYIEPGEWEITETVTLPSYVSIFGEGDTSVLVAADLLNDHVFENEDLVAGNTDIHLGHFKIDGNKAGQTCAVGLSDGVHMDNVTNCSFEKITITEMRGSGLDIQGTNINVDECDIDTCDEHGVIARAGTDGFFVHKGETSYMTNHGVSFEDVNNVQVQSHHSHHNTKNGINGIIVKQARFTDNWLYNNTWSGLDVEDLENAVINDNYSYNNALSGLVAEQYPTVWAPSRNVTFTGNIVYNNGWAGILLQEVLGGSVTGNVGWNNSRLQSDIGAMVHLKYDSGYPYDPTHRNLQISIVGNSYVDNRAISLSTYAYAMNGTNGVSASGNYITFAGNAAVGYLTSAVRIITDAGTDNNIEIGTT